VRPATRQSLFLVFLVVSLAGPIALVLWHPSAELTPAEARTFATRLANREFARQPRKIDAVGDSLPPFSLKPGDWHVAERRGDRWHFEFGPSENQWVTVSFDARGREVEVCIPRTTE